MSVHDYMMYDKENKRVVVSFDNYRGNGFIKATKKLEIAKAKILTRKDMSNMEPGSPDVLIRTASGLQYFVSREELAKNYRHASGKKIIIPTLRSDTFYTVTKSCNEPYAALLLPTNMVGILRDKPVGSGNYIIAPMNENEEIDYSKLAFISRKLFRKMFFIPMQDVIKRNKNNVGYTSGSILGRKSNRINRPATVNAPVRDYGLDVTKFNIPSVNDVNTSDVKISSDRLNKSNDEIVIDKNRYNFRAIGRIVNTNKEVIGYIIEDTKGNRRNLRTETVMKMCSEHKIANIMLTKNESGKYYLRGNGIRLESLPQFLE